MKTNIGSWQNRLAQYGHRISKSSTKWMTLVALVRLCEVSTGVLAEGETMRMSANSIMMSQTRPQAVRQTGTVWIFLLNSSGVLQDVSTTTKYKAPHVIDLYGNVLGTVGSDNVVYDQDGPDGPYGTVIGFIETDVVPVNP